MTHDDKHDRKVEIDSFGFLHIPAGQFPTMPTSALLVDLRHRLRNPHDDPAMRELTGLDEAVRHHVLTTPGAFQLIKDVAQQIEVLLGGYADPKNLIVRVLVGCQGGRHRSVAVAEEVGALLEARGIVTIVTHRDINKPVVQR